MEKEIEVSELGYAEKALRSSVGLLVAVSALLEEELAFRLGFRIRSIEGLEVDRED